MALNTNNDLRNSIIYSIYIRNHSKCGTFRGIIQDLDRICDLGVDILWFLPIHPIGQEKRKGNLGCPYSIYDYGKVNSEYGTLDDFMELICEIHKRKMKIMIDVVYNHTSHQSRLYKSNPEYFYRKSDGNVGNKCGEWYDVIDLDYSNKELWNEQTRTLKYWASIGVDGFRCDVAPMVPIEFWINARSEVEKINSSLIWLAETLHPSFIQENRNRGFVGHSDSEMYQAFDITYDYDVNNEYKGYFEGKNSLKEFLERKKMQEWIYPVNYLKLRFLENHDQPRVAKLITDMDKLINWTSFMFFEKGVTLLYAGQETVNTHTPSLFDRDLVNWNIEDEHFYSLIKKLAQFKKSEIIREGVYDITSTGEQGVIEATYKYNGKTMIGLFNVEGKVGSVAIGGGDVVPNGRYLNLLDGKEIEIKDNMQEMTKKPVIVEVSNV